jgi:hypothetical protein
VGVPPEVPNRDWQRQRQRAQDPGGGREDDCGITHFKVLPSRRLTRLRLRDIAQRKMALFFKYIYHYDTRVPQFAWLCRALRTISRSSPQKAGNPARRRDQWGYCRWRSLRWLARGVVLSLLILALGATANTGRARPRAGASSRKETPRVKSRPGPSMTLATPLTAKVRMIVWCKACGHQVESDPAEHARRYGAEMTVPDWRRRLVCSRCGSHEIDLVATGTVRQPREGQ